MKNPLNQYLSFLNYQKLSTSAMSNLMTSGGSENNDNSMLDENLDDNFFDDEEKIKKDIEMNSAGSGKRLANFIIDTIFFYVFAILIGLILGIFAASFGDPEFLYDDSPTSTLFYYLIGFVLVVLYYTLLEASTGRSIGKYITGTKVVNMRREKPDVGTIIIRSMCRCIPFEAFSFLNSKASGWHDSMSGTRVINVKHFLD